ncbi:hypothetical protein [Amycolatopsis nigrescens]|uniref:hypothetical protein n=1 Tax=Amycolatopsis nigrescens TaxID=381445 RepID=UPI00035FA6E8|nr:hypothetical protein [Amycolatopsis nigrescens]
MVKKVLGAMVPVLASVFVAGGAVQAQAAEGDRSYASVTGTARLDYVTAADDVRLTLDAHAVFDSPSSVPTHAWGTARISHYFSEPDVTVWAEATVDCVTAGGRSATVTAVVDDTAPEIADWRGKRIGVSIYSGSTGERAMVGSSGPMPVAELPKCMAPAPELPLRWGGYQVSRR